METWSLSERQERLLTRSVGETEGRTVMGLTSVFGLISTFQCTQQGKQTEPCSAGTWLVLPPLLWIILALTGVDFYVFVAPLRAWTQLQPTPETMSEQPVKMCCIAHSCFPYLHHQDHCGDDCPNDVTPVWVECNVDMMFPSPNMSSSSVSAISTNSCVCVSVCKVATPNVQLC